MSVGTPRQAGCLTNDQVVGLREGTLEERERLAAVEHIEGCADCLQLLGRSNGADEPPGPSLELDGRFALREPIGRGGMGVVYRAFDHRLDREVAIKLLHQAMFDGGLGTRDRLLAESKAMARLRHPNVVAVHDVVLTESRGFVVMELVVGDTLRSWLRSGERSWKDIVRMFIEAGRGLAAAHEAGLIHRDFKPDNVLVDGRGRPLVTDFGLANIMEPGSDDESIDEQSPLVTAGRCGTPAYMPPEQLEGGPVDPRADLFSFCVALWEAVSGERPFAEQSIRGRVAAIYGRELREPPPGVMPARLRNVLAGGLQPAPADRPASMDALLSELESLLSEPGRRRAWRPVVALGVVAVVGMAATLAQLSSHGGSECPQVAHWRNFEDAQLDRLERQLADDASDPGPSNTLMAAQVRRELEAFDQKLSMTRAETCTLEETDAVPPQELAAREVCLDRLEVRLQTVFELLESGTPAALEELGSPRLFDRCARWASAHVDSGSSLPADPNLQRALARVAVLTAVDAPNAPSVAREVVRRAEAAGHPSSLSEAHQHLASALWVLDRDAAVASLDAAAAAAALADDAARETTVWITRSIFFADAGNAEETNRALERAEQSLEGVRAPWLREELLTVVKTAQSMSAIFEGDGALALGLALEARDLAREHRPALVPLLTEQVATLRGIDGDLKGVIEEWAQLASWHEARGPAGAPDLVLVLLDIADAEATLGRPDEARAQLRKAEQIARSVRLAPGMASMVELTRASIAHADEDLEAALQASTKAMELAPEGSTERQDALAARGYVLMRLGRLREATEILEGLRDSLGLDADQPDFGLSYDILVDLAETYRRDGQPQRALETTEPVWVWFRDNFPNVPETITIGLRTAWIYTDLGRDEEATVVFERVLTSDPAPPQEHWARAGLATIDARQGPLDTEARQALAQARRYFARFPASRAHELERIDALVPTAPRSEREVGQAEGVHDPPHGQE